MQLYLTIQGCVNFTQLARFGRSCESSFRQNFRKSINQIAFNKTSEAFWADVWSVALEREVRVVIVDCLDDKKKTQNRKVFSSTDLTISPQDVIEIYTSRFQIEFFFRDSKLFTGLTNCQARNKEALAFAFNISLSSINVARAFARQNNYDISIG